MTGYSDSWGASWGDLNGDNRPDLYHNGHRRYPRLYRNTGDGSFEDVTYEVDPGIWLGHNDKHGASWADFDNDGDMDLLQGVSATGNAQLMVNTNGKFVDLALAAEISSDSTARQPVWFDYSRDGFLDVAQLYIGNSYLRRRDTTQALDFDDDKSGTQFNCPGQLNYGQLIDFNNDGKLDFLCAEEGFFPLRVFNISVRPFVNITSTVVSTTGNVNDTVVADFNNDLLADMVLIRGALRGSGATLVNPNRIESWLRSSASSSPDKGFTFRAPGDITLAIDHNGMGRFADSKIFHLNSATHTTLTVGPVTIRFNTSQSRWEITVSNADVTQAYLQIDTTANVADLTMTGLDTPELPIEMRHAVNSPTGMAFNFGTGLNTPVSCVSGVAGDFNNDMWVDLYLVCREGVNNLANRVYENQGNGTFALVTNHGGEGPVGAGFSYGVGDSVVSADYDVDGFLDLFVTNGLLYFPFGVGGPDTMLRNKGNSNRWIEIDLVGARRTSTAGTFSNRDGVGARVFVTAGGVTQLREQNGGYHRWSQNHQRLHFGLADNQTVSAIRVEWPSGLIDNYTNVASNQLYKANENGPLVPVTLGPPVHTTLQPGDECGQPPYNLDYGPITLLWRDCPSGVWHFRAKGGREEKQLLVTAGKITADAPFSGVTAFQLGGGNTLNTSVPNQIAFSIGVWFTNDRGFDFNTAGQSSACFALTRKDIGALVVGSSKKRIYGSFDLFSLGSCSPPPPPGPECGQPTYNKATEPGLYAWRDCNFSSSTARWIFRAVGGGLSAGTYAGQITGGVPLAASAPFSIESNDRLDTTPGDSIVDFSMIVSGSGQDGFQVDVPTGASACLSTSSLPGGTSVTIGVNRQVMSGPFDLVTLRPC